MLGVAGLDVFETVPHHKSMLLRLPNIVASDHTAWYSEVTVFAIQMDAAEHARQIVADLGPSNWINTCWERLIMAMQDAVDIRFCRHDW